MKRSVLLTVVFVAVWAARVLAASPEEIVQKSQAAFYYPGTDFKARVLMKLISPNGQERVREMTMLRLNTDKPGGEQKYFIYFFQPAEVRDMTFMVYKYPEKDDDRWLFVPAINMVRRIAMQDKQASFVGSDFTYEDVSGRDLGDDTYEMIKEEAVNGKECFVVKSTPKAGSADYGYKLSWIDKATYLPLKEEYYDQGGTVTRVFTADEVQVAKGFPTVTKRTMKNLKSGHRTEVSYVSQDYNVGLDESLFSERFLRQPPKKWIE